MTRTPGTPAPPTVGTPAPDFSARTHHGEHLRLRDLAGSPAALVFYPFAFSRVCSGEIAALHARRDRFSSLGAQVVGISCDAMHTLRAYADEISAGAAEGLGLTLLSDFWPHGAVAEAYGCFDLVRGAAGRLTVVLDAGLRVSAVQTADLGSARDPDQTLDLLHGAA